MTITTTLAKIRKHKPRKESWKKLYKSLGGIEAYGEHTPLKFSQIIENVGVEYAIWCLRSICPEHDADVRLFAADCAESVLHVFKKSYPDDDRCPKAIKAARDFANGLITRHELECARDYANSDWFWARHHARFACGAASDAARVDPGVGAERAADTASGLVADAKAARHKQANLLIERFG